MSVLEWFFIGTIILFFIGVVFYALGDLFRDRGYYKDKLKNVQKMSDYKNKGSAKSSQSAKASQSRTRKV